MGTYSSFNEPMERQWRFRKKWLLILLPITIFLLYEYYPFWRTIRNVQYGFRYKIPVAMPWGRLEVLPGPWSFDGFGNMKKSQFDQVQCPTVLFSSFSKCDGIVQNLVFEEPSAGQKFKGINFDRTFFVVFYKESPFVSLRSFARIVNSVTFEN